MSALGRPIICAVTGGAGAAEVTLQAAAAAVRAGVDLLHVRERQLADRDLFSLVTRVVDLARGTATRVVVNDRADVAIAAGAAGVHLRADSVRASSVRGIAPANFVVGRSVHDVPDAQAAEADGGCDYLVFGTVYRSPSKRVGHAVAGLEALARVTAAVGLPVLAIGGVTVERAGEVVRAGAAGIAAIGLFADPAATLAVVAALRARFDT